MTKNLIYCEFINPKRNIVKKKGGSEIWGIEKDFFLVPSKVRLFEVLYSADWIEIKLSSFLGLAEYHTVSVKLSKKEQILILPSLNGADIY